MVYKQTLAAYHTTSFRKPDPAMSAYWQPLKQLRPLLLIGLMAGLLLGVQLLQASPLHQHTQHAVECTLCHLQAGDTALLQQAPALPFVAGTAPSGTLLVAFAISTTTSPYQSRAPPPYSA
jgi:hypothetical protein